MSNPKSPESPEPQRATDGVERAPQGPNGARRGARNPDAGAAFPFARSAEEDEIREMYGWGV